MKVNGTCEGQAPMAVPKYTSYYGSSVFIAHVGAADQFREDILAVFFATLDPPIPDASEFAKKLKKRGSDQLSFHGRTYQRPHAPLRVDS